VEGKRVEIVRWEWYQKLIEEYNQKFGKSIKITKKMMNKMEKYKFRRSDVESTLYLIERYKKPVSWIIRWKVEYGYTFEEIDKILEISEYLGCQVYTVRKLLDICDRDLYLFDRLIDYILTNRAYNDTQILKFARYLETNYASVEEFFAWLDYEEGWPEEE
jgi:transcriptional regulator with PAS, ATPase and Fis domain